MKRLLIIGCGDVASRALAPLRAVFRVTALVRMLHSATPLSAAGVELIEGDLDRPGTLSGLNGPYDCLLHCAPPPDHGHTDTRTRHLLAALSVGGKRGEIVPQRLVYLSTSGVYGDCGGAQVDESRPLNPGTARAVRRADAESALSEWCTRRGVSLAVFRVPGIYADDRLPLARLRAGLPALLPEEDVYTNHVHADDLARIIVAALRNESASGAFNVCDDTQIKAGDWLDLVADRFGLPRPPRLSRREVERRLSPLQWSFLNESRRLVNRRMKSAFATPLRYGTVYEGVPRRTFSPVSEC